MAAQNLLPRAAISLQSLETRDTWPSMSISRPPLLDEATVLQYAVLGRPAVKRAASAIEPAALQPHQHGGPGQASTQAPGLLLGDLPAVQFPADSWLPSSMSPLARQAAVSALQQAAANSAALDATSTLPQRPRRAPKGVEAAWSALPQSLRQSDVAFDKKQGMWRCRVKHRNGSTVASSRSLLRVLIQRDFLQLLPGGWVPARPARPGQPLAVLEVKLLARLFLSTDASSECPPGALPLRWTGPAPEALDAHVPGQEELNLSNISAAARAAQQQAAPHAEQSLEVQPRGRATASLNLPLSPGTMGVVRAEATAASLPSLRVLLQSSRPTMSFTQSGPAP